MVYTIIGIIFLLFPFLLMAKFTDKKLGFVYIFSFIIATQLFIAIITQLFHVFNYPVALTVNAIIFIIIAIKTDWRKLIGELKLNLWKMDWLLIFVSVIAFICLFSVHYNYSGKYSVAVASQYQQGENMRYAYPYYADEWYAVAFIKDSIDSHSLPLKNPLAPPAWNERFVNLEFISHSFLAELVLLLRLDPLTDYSVLAIFSGLIICWLVYLFLRQSQVNKFSAAVISLSTLYLTNGANLPGIWYLIPLTLGIISLLLSFFFISLGDNKMTLFMAAITLLFYPPLAVFYSLAMLSLFVFAKDKPIREKAKSLLSYLVIAVIAAAVLSSSYFLTKSPRADFYSYIFSKISYATFTEKAVPRYDIYNIIPLPILILAILGIISLVKSREKIWLLAMLGLGLAYWALYFLALFRFIIEWQRVIVFTSILAVLVAGFGLSYLIEILKRIEFVKRNNILNYIQVAVLILFFIFSFSYTKNNNWQKLKLIHLESGQTFMPAAPANKYLQPDDLELFKNISRQKFLSLPWKGTVIGTATNNYPFSTKAGTITINQNLPYEFMGADCDKKNQIADARDLRYIYLPEFDCQKFSFIGASKEGLYLYEFSEE